jgi:hypothetical protein
LLFSLQPKLIVASPVKEEKPTASFDKSVYLKEQKVVSKKWEDFFNADDFASTTTRPSLLELFTCVSSNFIYSTKTDLLVYLVRGGI